MRVRAEGWTKVAVVWVCVLALAGSCWMLGCGDDKADEGNGNGNGEPAAKEPAAPEPPAPAPGPKTKPATAGKKRPGIFERLGGKLTDGK